MDGIAIGCKKWDYALVVRHFYENENLGEQIYLLEAAKPARIIISAS